MTKLVLCPPTPAGLALGAMLRLFGSGADRRALEEVFDVGFLASVGVEEIMTMFEAVGEASLSEVEGLSAHELNARLRATTGDVARLRLVVAPRAPHRVTGLVVRPEGRHRTGVTFDGLLPPPLTVHAASLTSEALDERLRATLVGVLTAREVTGMALAVVERGRVALHASCGWAAAVERRPVEARTVFRAYSLTRLITAVAVLQMWEEQQFDLDDPVNDHLRSMRVQGPGRPVTVRDLLCDRSGLGSVAGADLWRTQAAPAAKVFGAVVRAAERPGNVVSSDAGYGVLAQLVEDLTGKPFEEHVHTNVLTPLGMVSSDLRRSDPPGEQFASGHDVAFGDVTVAPTAVAALLGSGGLFTTAPDLAAFALAVIGGGANGAGRVLSPQTMALATRPVAKGLGVGLGFQITALGSDRCVWHRGAGPGFSSVIAVAPERGAAVALLANTTGRTAGKGGLEEDALSMLQDVIDGR